MELGATHRSLSALADATTRQPALDVLARQLDARAVLVAVPELADAMRLIAAPSTPALPTTPCWRKLLDRCKTPGVHEASLKYPAEGGEVSAVGYAFPQLALIVVGHKRANLDLAATVATVAPLLAALLRVEQQAAATRAEVIARIGQELREPLAPIATAVQMLRLEGKQTPIHDILERQVTRLMRLTDELLTETSASPRTAVPCNRTRADRGSVLVVDDNRDAADLLGALLESLGYEVRVAHTGPDGLAELAQFTPDVALLDIGLPGMDGYQLARAMHERLPALPLIAITGYGQDKDRERALDAGFAAHLVKPVSIGKLGETLDVLLPRTP